MEISESQSFLETNRDLLNLREALEAVDGMVCGSIDTDQLLEEITRKMANIASVQMSKTLASAGLGSFNEELPPENQPNCLLANGLPLLGGVVTMVRGIEKQARYVAILLNEGADPNYKDEEGKSPLMHACLLGADRAAKELIFWPKTDLFAKDTQGNTALMYAAHKGHLRILRYYCKAYRKLEKSARQVDAFEMRNKDGETAKDLAKSGGFNDCAEFLDQEKSKRYRTLTKQLSAIAGGRLSPLTNRLKPMASSGSFDSLFNADGQTDKLMEDRNITNYRSVSYALKHGSSPDLTRDDTLDETAGTSARSQSIDNRRVSAYDNIAALSGDVPQLKNSLDAEYVPKQNLTNRIRNIFQKRPRYYKSSSSYEDIVQPPKSADEAKMRRSRTDQLNVGDRSEEATGMLGTPASIGADNGAGDEYNKISISLSISNINNNNDSSADNTMRPKSSTLVETSKELLQQRSQLHNFRIKSSPSDRKDISLPPIKNTKNRRDSVNALLSKLSVDSHKQATDNAP